MILILSDAFDVHADYVISKISALHIPFYRLNLDVNSLKKTYVSYENDIWLIDNGENKVTSNLITGVWCRRAFVEQTLEEQQDNSVDFKIWKNEWNQTLLGLYNSLKCVPWLNPLRKAYKGENKYYQMEVAKEVGFDFPKTLVSNDKEKIKSFVQGNNRTLFKLMSQEMYDIGNNDFRGLYTNIIGIQDLENFNTEEENPIVFQEYIEKQYEVRYTVVGKKHYVCRIESQASEKAKEDWRRYDIIHTPHYSMEPPEEIREKVDSMMNILGLEFGALDFIVTPDNKWVFLEINCMGQWLWIEQLTGLQISASIVEWIKRHSAETEDIR